MKLISFSMALIVAAVLIVVRIVRCIWPAKIEPTHLCPRCHQFVLPLESEPKHELVTVMTMFFYVVPGLMWLIDRWERLSLTCPLCKCKNLLPLDSLAARRLLK